MGEPSLLTRLAREVYKHHPRPHALNPDLCAVCALLREYEALGIGYYPEVAHKEGTDG